MQTISVKREGKLIATMEVDADGSVTVFGKIKGQRRNQCLEIDDIYPLSMSDIMALRDCRSDEPLSEYLEALIQDIWCLAAEEDSWFAFCCA